MGGVLTAALVPFAAPFFHFVFVTIAPASPEAAAAAVTPEHVAASTAAVTRIPGLRPDRPYDLAGLLLLSGGAAPPAAGHHRHVCGRDQHLRQPGAGRRLVGVPADGRRRRCLATTGTRWMIAAIMLIFVAALTPGFRRSRLRRKGARSARKSEPAPPFPTSPNGAVSTSPSSSPPGSPSRPTLSMAIRCR